MLQRDEDVVMVVLGEGCRDGQGCEATGATLPPLTEDVLAFERLLWHRRSAKDAAIRERFGVSPAAYYVILSDIIESDEAVCYDPLLVQRLQRRVARRTPAGAGR